VNLILDTITVKSPHGTVPSFFARARTGVVEEEDMRAPRLLAMASAAALALVIACGTDPIGVETCRRIETARCESAPACGVDLGTPVHRGDDPKSAVAACVRFYEDACLHGIAGPEDPGAVKTQACVDAIINGSCDVVKTPETSPDCAFLIPPAPPPQAPAPVADAATE
jgi:hypothetical protein